MDRTWDIAIIGSGGAGLTAAIYAARAGRSVALFDPGVIGGQIATAGMVENYPGFPDGILGADLSDAMCRQAERFGAVHIAASVTRLAPDGDGFTLETPEARYRARSTIVTAGAEYRRLNVPGETEYIGRGVSYCATCDGAFFRDLEVAVVGGGDAAIDEGLFLTRHARRVRVIHRRDELRASRILQDRAFANPRMDFTWNTVVERIEGSDAGVSGVALRNTVTGETSTMEVAGVFVFIGQDPNSGLLRELVPLDPGGHAIVDLSMRTPVPGLFVAGDVRTEAARQLITACGDGATAAIAADRYLAEQD